MGSTKRVSKVAVINPPITTVANGRCTSAPAPWLSAIGRKPREATEAVINTGLSLIFVPFSIRAFTSPGSVFKEIELGDQHDSIQYRHTKQRNEANAGRNAEWHPPQVKRQHTTDG